MVIGAMINNETVRRAQNGDRAAFAALVREYGARAVNLAHQLVGNRELAGEIAQEALVKAWGNLRQLKSEAAFYPWLARIVVNQARNQFRAAGRRPASATDIDGELNLDNGGMTVSGRVNDEVEPPFKTAQLRELKAAMHKAMAELPFNYRSALAMFTLDGMSHAEIAATLEIPEETVRWRVHQARKMLREKLKEYID
jgi:RNA polymerase sigma-70 factor (ECF subfamily)